MEPHDVFTKWSSMVTKTKIPRKKNASPHKDSKMGSTAKDVNVTKLSSAVPKIENRPKRKPWNDLVTYEEIMSSEMLQSIYLNGYSTSGQPLRCDDPLYMALLNTKADELIATKLPLNRKRRQTSTSTSSSKSSITGPKSPEPNHNWAYSKKSQAHQTPGETKTNNKITSTDVPQAGTSKDFRIGQRHYDYKNEPSTSKHVVPRDDKVRLTETRKRIHQSPKRPVFGPLIRVENTETKYAPLGAMRKKLTPLGRLRKKTENASQTTEISSLPSKTLLESLELKSNIGKTIVDTNAQQSLLKHMISQKLGDAIKKCNNTMLSTPQAMATEQPQPTTYTLRGSNTDVIDMEVDD